MKPVEAKAGKQLLTNAHIQTRTLKHRHTHAHTHTRTHKKDLLKAMNELEPFLCS